jgi:hypothetical protein
MHGAVIKITKLWTSLSRNLEVPIQNTGPTLAEFDVLNTQVTKAQRDVSEGTKTKTWVISCIVSTDSQAPLDIPEGFARDNFAFPAELSVVCCLPATFRIESPQHS